MKCRIIILFAIFSINAVGQQYISNAASAATCNALVAAVEPTGLPTNLASLVNSDRSFVETTAFNKYSIKELTGFALTGSLRINPNNSLAISLMKFGNGPFTEQSVEAGFSKRLNGKFSTGVKVIYYQWKLDDSKYEDSQAWIPEISFLLCALPRFSMGVTLRNPVRSRMNANELKKLPATIHSGIASAVSEKLTLVASVISSSNTAMSYQAGIEYRYSKLLVLRTGLQSLPLASSYGFQLGISNYELSVSMQNNQQLGISSTVTFLFKL